MPGPVPPMLYRGPRLAPESLSMGRRDRSAARTPSGPGLAEPGLRLSGQSTRPAQSPAQIRVLLVPRPYIEEQHNDASASQNAQPQPGRNKRERERGSGKKDRRPDCPERPLALTRIRQGSVHGRTLSKPVQSQKRDLQRGYPPDRRIIRTLTQSRVASARASGHCAARTCLQGRLA